MSQESRIEIVNRDGWRKEQPLLKGIVYIGSAPTNDIVLESQHGGGVAPLHAQLIATSNDNGLYKLVNLSDSEIWLGSTGEESVPPRSVINLMDGDTLRMGEFTLVYRAGSGSGLGGALQQGGGRAIGLTLTLPYTRLAPNQTLEGTVTVRNLGGKTGVRFDVELEGLDEDCFDIAPGPLLSSGAEKEVLFRLHHRGVKPLAGDWYITIRAFALGAYPGEEAAVTQKIEVLPLFRHQVRLLPSPGLVVTPRPQEVRVFSARQPDTRPTRPIRAEPVQPEPPLTGPGVDNMEGETTEEWQWVAEAKPDRPAPVPSTEPKAAGPRLIEPPPVETTPAPVLTGPTATGPPAQVAPEPPLAQPVEAVTSPLPPEPPSQRREEMEPLPPPVERSTSPPVEEATLPETETTQISQTGRWWQRISASLPFWRRKGQTQTEPAEVKMEPGRSDQIETGLRVTPESPSNLAGSSQTPVASEPPLAVDRVVEEPAGPPVEEAIVQPQLTSLETEAAVETPVETMAAAPVSSEVEPNIEPAGPTEPAPDELDTTVAETADQPVETVEIGAENVMTPVTSSGDWETESVESIPPVAAPPEPEVTPPPVDQKDESHQEEAKPAGEDWWTSEIEANAPVQPEPQQVIKLKASPPAQPAQPRRAPEETEEWWVADSEKQSQQ